MIYYDEEDFIIGFSEYYIFAVGNPLLKDSEIMSVLKLGFHKDINSIIIEKLKAIMIIENIYLQEIDRSIIREIDEERREIRREEDERSIFLSISFCR